MIEKQCKLSEYLGDKFVAKLIKMSLNMGNVELLDEAGPNPFGTPLASITEAPNTRKFTERSNAILLTPTMQETPSRVGKRIPVSLFKDRRHK
jgi:hypothetical protein